MFLPYYVWFYEWQSDSLKILYYLVGPSLSVNYENFAFPSKDFFWKSVIINVAFQVPKTFLRSYSHYIAKTSLLPSHKMKQEYM